MAFNILVAASSPVAMATNPHPLEAMLLDYASAHPHFSLVCSPSQLISLGFSNWQILYQGLFGLSTIAQNQPVKGTHRSASIGSRTYTAKEELSCSLFLFNF